MPLKKYMALCLVHIPLLIGICAPATAQEVPDSNKAQESIIQENSELSPKPTTNLTPEIRGELWTGKLYSSRYKAGACIDAKGNVHGVLILQLKNGDEDVYHFSGTKNIAGTLDVKHSSGHAFVGTFESATSIQGKVTTKNGFSMKLKGKREQNVLLNGPTCRPF